MSISKVTGIGAAGILGISFIQKLLSENEGSSRIKQIRQLEKIILGIASGQYVIALNIRDVRRVQKWRYADWLITTPLLLRTFYLLAVEKGYEGSFNVALGADLIMIVAGYLSEYQELTPQVSRMFWYVLSSAALVVILQQVTLWNNYLMDKGVDTGRLPIFFYIGWVGYGVNFLTPDHEIRQTGFNILDVFNKAVYSVELENVIRKL